MRSASADLRAIGLDFSKMENDSVITREGHWNFVQVRVRLLAFEHAGAAKKSIVNRPGNFGRRVFDRYPVGSACRVERTGVVGFPHRAVAVRVLIAAAIDQGHGLHLSRDAADHHGGESQREGQPERRLSPSTGIMRSLRIGRRLWSRTAARVSSVRTRHHVLIFRCFWNCCCFGKSCHGGCIG